MDSLFISVAIVAGLGLILGLALALADKYISVPKDEKEAQILSQLSGANCGSCGFAGCEAMAKALAEGKASISVCPVASQESRDNIATILGIEAEQHQPKAAVVACAGGIRCVNKSDYVGLEDCRAASLIGSKECRYGCLGLMTCARVCSQQAIIKNNNSVAEIITEKCISCKKCISVCPRGLISLQPINAKVILRCNTNDKGKTVRDICSVGCIGCGLCAKVCPEHAITMLDNKPVIDNSLCIGCGKCKEKCPSHALS